MKKQIVFLFIILLVGLGSCTIRPTTGISVDEVLTESGLIAGIKGNNPDVMVFKGIPYATPPSGDLRWKEPLPSKKWEGVRKCDAFGPVAMQKTSAPRDEYTSEFFIPADATMSEDCLYLNVWTAARSTQEKRPVFVYIHGGGFVENAGSIALFDGESMAQKGLVFVTINYRLGIFGFFSHPELTKESSHQASGNYGILDQIAALKWVKNNIEAFGGDPGNVTIAGQSAGALSVNALSVSPLARGLFHRIIAQSGACILPSSFGGTGDLQRAETRGLDLMKNAGIQSFKEMRDLSATDLQRLLPRGLGLVVDGYVIKEPIPETYAKGEQAPVPLMTGWNASEVQTDFMLTLAEYRDEIKNKYGEEAGIILELYPATTDEEARLARKKMGSELGFGVQNYAWARTQSALKNVPVYLYFFNHPMPAVGEMKKYGAFHTAEIPYSYDNLSKMNRPWEPGDFELAKIQSAYWANFATAGNPNAEGLPVWPEFNVDKGQTMILDILPAATKHPYFAALEIFFRKGQN